MNSTVKIDRDFDVVSRNCDGTKEIQNRGGRLFMVGDSKMAEYETGDSTQLRYWNEKTTAWESTWDAISFPLGTKFMGTINSRRGLMGVMDPTVNGIVEVYPFHIRHVDVNGSMQITKQPVLRFHTPIQSVHFSFDTDYLFALSRTHVYYWNADTPTTPPIMESDLRSDYRGVPIFARGSSLFFLYDGNAETMDEFDGSNGEWFRWSVGHNDDGLLPNLSGLRAGRRLAFFTPEVITVFAVSVADNSLWSLDVYDLFWKRLGELTQDGTPAEIISADGRTVFVRAGEETVSVTVAPLHEEETMKEEVEEEDEQMKQLRAELEEARAKRTSQLSKLRRIGVMLLQSGVDKKILDGIETGFELRIENGEEGDHREKLRSEIELIKESEPLYKKKLMKYMAMMSLSAIKKQEQTEVEGHKNEDGEEKNDTAKMSEEGDTIEESEA
ncbi:hypothetical protein PMAYCL1PPCAC_00167 [Pristionchus mayeri]|uniref:Uncharacterized protein n=1 Tax=Pristionchus mayeri TaxID=1317129 RepID=A0AAN5C4Q3_9BILA|nr:hypothetical protein PMAYCL1PPCAC_00167 [Pristionchus mayeri]